MIHRYKYGKKVQLRRPLGLLTAARLASFAGESAPDLLIPVPLHRKRLSERGFNQSLLIARVLEQEWRLPLVRAGLARIRWTEPQVRLSAAEREQNVRGAFAVADPSAVSGKRVMLVDDVFTTGSTVDECARVLRRAGAAGVQVVTVARAVSF
jgi:ComF family protein